jgi:lipopolysaccharide export system permease protein
MQLIDQYVAKRFYFFLILSVFGAMAIFLIVDPIENLDKFLDKDISTKEILRYYLLYIPYIIYLIYPVSTLLGTMFCMGGLTTSNELMAMTSSGIPLRRHLIHLSLIGFVFSIFMFWWGESVVPETNRERLSIWRQQVKGRKDWKMTDQGQVYLQDGKNRVIHLDVYQPRVQTGYGIDYYEFKAGDITKRITATSMKWQADRWVLFDAYVRSFGELEEAMHIEERMDIELAIVPSDMVELKIEPEEMSLQELKRFAKRIESTGGKADRWNVDIHSKIALPFSGLIIIFFGVPISSVRRRSGVIFGVTISLLISFLYFGLMQIGKVLGYKEIVDPWIAAWLGNIIFMVVGLILYKKTPR